MGCDNVRTYTVLDQIHQSYTSLPTINLKIEEAEFIKYCDNIWHALKVGFANEIGNVCKKLELDSHQIMDVFCKDKKLNISSHYLKPGFAFGGSCLPKDLRAFLYESQSLNIDLPILKSVLRSNQLQIDHAMKLITAQGNKHIGILGFSFKANTDDLRESPMVLTAEQKRVKMANKLNF